MPMNGNAKRPRITPDVYKEFKILAAKKETTTEYEIQLALEEWLKTKRKEVEENGKSNK